MIEVLLNGTFEDWRSHARELLQKEVAPSEIVWQEYGDQASLALGHSGGMPATHSEKSTSAKVPAAFLSLGRKVSFHRESRKWRLLYSVLWRIDRENHQLLKIETDDEVSELLKMRDQVARDEHHMHAFLRFRPIQREGATVYIAFYKPDHKIIGLTAPFFRERFASMQWSIFTPDGSAHWDGTELRYTAGVEPPAPQAGDQTEELWNLYYKTTYNPARTNLKLMRSHVPVRHWQGMPELADLAPSLATSEARVATMIKLQEESPGAAAFIPSNGTLHEMKDSICACHGCELYKHATQAVFGEGPTDARIVLIGEQPGDQEDRVGKPFVGPAGEMLDRALRDAAIDRKIVYITNVVKHFAFVERGKRRIHRTPRYSEIVACRPWLEAELKQLNPEVLVCLGASAAKALFGSQFRLTKDRGKLLASAFCKRTLVTYHPSAVLRAESDASSQHLYQMLVGDLRVAAEAIHKSGKEILQRI